MKEALRAELLRSTVDEARAKFYTEWQVHAANAQRSKNSIDALGSWQSRGCWHLTNSTS